MLTLWCRNVIPAKAGIQGGGAGPKFVHPEPVERRGSGPRIVRPEPVEEPAPYSIRGQCTAERPLSPSMGQSSTIVVPAEAGFLPQEPSPTQRGGAGPKIVRPEPVEEPAPYSIRGQCSAERPPSPSMGQSSTIVVPAKAGFLPQEPSPTQRGGDGQGFSSTEEGWEPVLSLTKDEGGTTTPLETTR